MTFGIDNDAALLLKITLELESLVDAEKRIEGLESLVHPKDFSARLWCTKIFSLR